MRIHKKLICLIVMCPVLVQLGLTPIVRAAPEVQRPPVNLSIDEIGSNSDGYYLDLRWEYPTDFFVPGNTGTYLNFYRQEVPKPYKSSTVGRVAMEKDIRADASLVTRRLEDLKSGTVYYLDMAAYYKYAEGTSTMVSLESEASRRIKVLTDIDIRAYATGTNQIKIEWDDVWNTNGRISYKLYISDSMNSAIAPTKNITPDDIGQGKPVQVNQSSGKLEYVHTVSNPGKVYYVKVVPDIFDTELKYYPEESRVATVASFILVRTSKVSSTSGGSIWRLDWSPVIVELGSGVDVQYEIYKGIIGSSELPGRIQTVSNTSIFVMMSPGEEAASYFIVWADIRKDGVRVYPGIDIKSDKVMLKDQEVPAYPPAPELVDSLEGGATGSVTGTDATILWRIPKKTDGSIDLDTSYDVWITTDPNIIDDPVKLGNPITWNLSSGNSTGGNGSFNIHFSLVRSGLNTVGCQAAITGFSPNATYYFKAQARKSYLEYNEDDQLVYTAYRSDPAFRIIITSPGGGINQPLTPCNPPFGVKKTDTGTDCVTDTSVTLQIQRSWYEEYLEDSNQWRYVRTEDDDPDNPVVFPASGVQYRKVVYDESVTADIYYVKYEPDVVYDNLFDDQQYHPTVVRGYGLEPNDPDENPTVNLELPEVPPEEREKRKVNLSVEGLEPNTTYVMWVRAARAGIGLLSEPSDPVVVTTHPVDVELPEKPTVPVLIVNHAGDTFVDLVWNFNNLYTYTIRYGTADNVETAAGNVNVDLQGKSYFRVDGLKKDTLYYFWIRAEHTTSQGQSEQSVWSDSVLVKTLPDVPPDTPQGFGLKNAVDAITSNSITFEWIPGEGLEYILEVADNIDYAQSREYKAGGASEFKVEDLRSNTRYYARLYAYDPQKELKSYPTGSVIIRTLRNRDDYDSFVDVDGVISGDFVVKDKKALRGVWTVRISGVNADRFIEFIQEDRDLDYFLDVSVPPANTNKVNVVISVRVYEALSNLKENLVFVTEGGRLVVRPGTVTRKLAGRQGDFDIAVSLEYRDAARADRTKNLSFRTGITTIGISVASTGIPTPILAAAAPLKFLVPYTGKSWYREGETFGAVFDTGSSQWMRLDTTNHFDAYSREGFVSFETKSAGDMTVVDLGSNYFDDISGHEFQSEINGVAALHTIKCIQGRLFRPDDGASITDAVRFVLDVMDYGYNGDEMPVAAKSGLIAAGDLDSPNALCTREKAICMVARAYEIKTGIPAKPSPAYTDIYADMSGVSGTCLAKVRFAAENGLIAGDYGNLLKPAAAVSRGEMIAMIARMLALVGEI